MKLVVVKAPVLLPGMSLPTEIELPVATQPPSSLVIGRYPTNDVIIPDKLISRQHLEIVVREDDLLLRDLGSQNGTIYNRFIQLPANRWTKVKPGDMVQLGLTLLRVEASATATHPSPAPAFATAVPELLELPSRLEEPNLNIIVAAMLPPVQDAIQELDSASDLSPVSPTLAELEEAETDIGNLLHEFGLEFEIPGPVQEENTTRYNLLAVQQLMQEEVVVATHELPAASQLEPLKTAAIELSPKLEEAAEFIPAHKAPVEFTLAPKVESDQPRLEKENSNPDALVPVAVTLSQAGSDRLGGIERRVRQLTEAKQIFWVYLALIGVAELLTAFSIVQIGLPLHAVLLVVFLVQGATDPDKSRRHLALALTLAPLIRLLSLSLPLLSFNQLIWYPLVAVPLLLTCWLIARHIGLKREDLGLRFGNVRLQVMLSLGGVGLGAIEYTILQPRPLFGIISWEILIIGGLNLLIFTGFNEEVIFRGMLQRLAEPVLKDKALIFLALLFAVLHMGYLSFLDLLFVFAVGLVFSYIVRWDRSLLGVIMAHGLTNTTMFLIMPYAAEFPDDPWSQLVPWLIGLTTLISGLGLAGLARQGGFFKRFKLDRLTGKSAKSLENRA